MNIKIIYKHLTAAILVAALLTQTFNKWFVMADYYSNTGSYAKKCENKLRPQMHCNGKCQMIKKLDQEEKKDQQNPNRRTNQNDDVFFENSFFVLTDKPEYSLQNLFRHKPASLCINHTPGIFRPPQSGSNQSNIA